MLLCFLLSLLPTYTQGAWGLENCDTDVWKRTILEGIESVCQRKMKLYYDSNRLKFLRQNAYGQNDRKQNIYCTKFDPKKLKDGAVSLVYAVLLEVGYELGLISACEAMERKPHYGCVDYWGGWLRNKPYLCCGFYANPKSN
ncbi:unnamed protein product [Cylicocyclus nassatus]|uniref:Secreted protein n=1 Tax=Cylicocyclus nassatus TaxID=53992 RepID=A0AA36GJ98_CYLNA|nr:unnamed protein product [Cylicocyclus nassatus]